MPPLRTGSGRLLGWIHGLTLNCATCRKDGASECRQAPVGATHPCTGLKRCGCTDLLGRWRARGGDPLDHADFAHYKRIMTHPENFSRVFASGFDDPQELATLIDRAGRLRAASHHGRSFSEEDLRELRVTWRTLQTGLENLIEPYDDAKFDE